MAATSGAGSSELDARNAQVARSLAPDGIEVVEADAGNTDAAVGAAPVDLLLLCGIFGNVADDDVERTVSAVPQLCAPGATVIWTRSTHPPDLTPAVRRWFAGAGVHETAFVTEGPGGWAVGAGTFHGRPRALVPAAACSLSPDARRPDHREPTDNHGGHKSRGHRCGRPFSKLRGTISNFVTESASRRVGESASRRVGESASRRVGEERGRGSR